MAILFSGNGETDPNVGRPAYGRATRRSLLHGEEKQSKKGSLGTSIQIPGALGETTPEQAKAWMKAQIPYPNLASNEEVASRAVDFVKRQKKQFEQRTMEIHDKWRALDYALRGNSLSRRFLSSDLHVPEMYKAVQILVPRIEEALMQFDPWYHVRGRDQDDREKAFKISAWLDHLLDLSGFDQMVQPAIYSMIVYGFFDLKTWWDIEIRSGVTRSVTRQDETNGLPGGYNIEVDEEDKVVFEGARIKLVDPYDFIADPREIDVQKGLYVGDVGVMSIDEYERYEQLGLYLNTDELRERKSKRSKSSLLRYSKSARALDSMTLDPKNIEGSPEIFENTSLWCRFDPYGDGNYEEYVIEIADEDVCLRVQKNPHDDRHRPHAVARSSREPFDFFNVGPLDHAMRLNLELDEHRNYALQSHALSLHPMVWLEDTDDTPDNLFHAEPGSIFRSRSQPNILKVPSTVGEMQGMEETLRRDIEETTGALRMFESPAGTATEVERKVQENNRRIRAYVTSASEGFETLLKHLYALSAQFVMKRHSFRVLGKTAKGIPGFADIDPEVLQTAIDFEFVGPSALHTEGLRATNMATFLNLAYPLMAQNPKMVNTAAILSDLYKTIVGTRVADEVINVPQNYDELLSPEDERDLLLVGQDVEPHEAENEIEHLKSHIADVQAEWFLELPIYVQEAYLKHIAKTQMQYRSKKAREGAQSRAPQMFPGNAVDEEGMPMERGGTQKGRSGRGDLAPPVTSQSVPGEAPGPPSLQNVSAADRGMSIPQTENRV